MLTPTSSSLLVFEYLHVADMKTHGHHKLHNTFAFSLNCSFLRSQSVAQGKLNTYVKRSFAIVDLGSHICGSGLSAQDQVGPQKPISSFKTILNVRICFCKKRWFSKLNLGPRLRNPQESGIPARRATPGRVISDEFAISTPIYRETLKGFLHLFHF